MNNKMRIIAIIGVTLLLILTIGTTLALYGYSNVSSSDSQIIAGEIYMKYLNGSTKNITMVPSNTYREGEYFEFTIEGKNTSSRNIIYDIVLNHGDDLDNPKIRLNDKFLRFRLVTVSNNVETAVVNEIAYETIDDTTIYVGQIAGGTTTQTDITYRLYVWVEGVIVGNVNQDYTTEQWPDVYTNIDVEVNGDFSDKNESIGTSFVKFNTNGGSVSPTVKLYTSGDTYDELPTPTKTGYNFSGWYLENTYETEITASSIVGNDTNINLYAKWIVDAISNISFTTSPLSIYPTHTSTTALTYSGTAKTIAYSSSDTGIATVNSSGVITGVLGGTAVITVTITDYDDNITTETVSVTVLEVWAENVSYNPPNGATCDDGNGSCNVQLMLDNIADMLN